MKETVNCHRFLRFSFACTSFSRMRLLKRRQIDS